MGFTGSLYSTKNDLFDQLSCKMSEGVGLELSVSVSERSLPLSSAHEFSLSCTKLYYYILEHSPASSSTLITVQVVFIVPP